MITGHARIQPPQDSYKPRKLAACLHWIQMLNLIKGTQSPSNLGHIQTTCSNMLQQKKHSSEHGTQTLPQTESEPLVHTFMVTQL